MDAPQPAMQPKRLNLEAVRNFLKDHWRDYAVLFLIAGIVIGLDQWTKSLVRTKLPLGGIWMPLDWLRPYARIIHWYNSGAAFGMFQNGGIIFTVLAIIVVGLILYYFPRTSPRDWSFRLALGLQFGGAVGNLIDRLMLDWKVTDFISLGTFPVFNVADGSITVGVFVLILGAWLKDRSQKQAAAGPASSGDEASGESAGVESSAKEEETRSE